MMATDNSKLSMTKVDRLIIEVERVVMSDSYNMRPRLIRAQPQRREKALAKNRFENRKQGLSGSLQISQRLKIKQGSM